MTQSNRWLLPDGVEDMLPDEALKAESIRRELLDNFSRWGYELIITPVIEYLESLLTGTGNDLALKTFKVTDQLSGRLMGVRADITPQAARIDSHVMSGKGVNRLCYADTVLHTLPQHALTHRCPFQVGCELFGASGLAGDIEVISLMISSLQHVGIRNLHIDLAHIGIYRGLIESANLSQSLELDVFDALRRKSVPELDALVNGANVEDESALKNIRNLATSGGFECIEEIKQQINPLPTSVQQAFSELQSIGEMINARFPDVSLGVDFSELRGYHYHTGLIFSAYVQGKGDAVAQGGRYDSIGKLFGRSRPATGFSADLKTIVSYSENSRITPKKSAIWVAYQEKVDPDLWTTLNNLRETESVIQAVEPDQETAANCDRKLVNLKGEWVVVSL
jgi:ATP phosphoribosyltransferase regulatory subunit